ncbi:MAG: SDR family NAD(P)-dependent oxidoreductase [Bradymonadia bacterium]|jgi:NAD(P)-dependent dehydrogenase (short-subunit alcohol dehydrogenase family)
MTHPVVLVSGASRGIGEAVARALAARGHRVALAARDAAALERIAAEIGGLAVPMDVCDAASVDAGVQRVRETLGPIGVLVPNAGIARSAPVHRTTDADVDALLDVNYKGSFRLVRACLPDMLTAGWGRVVFVASNAGLMGYRYTAAYSASKHAVIGLMRSLAIEVAARGITSNAVCPGFVETDMAQDAIDRIVRSTGRSADDARAELAALSPQRRLVQVAEVAAAVCYLASPEAVGVNGHALSVDGGQTQY